MKQLYYHSIESAAINLNYSSLSPFTFSAIEWTNFVEMGDEAPINRDLQFDEKVRKRVLSVIGA